MSEAFSGKAALIVTISIDAQLEKSWVSQTVPELSR